LCLCVCVLVSVCVCVCLCPIVFEHSTMCSSVRMRIVAHISTFICLPTSFSQKSRFVWLINL